MNRILIIIFIFCTAIVKAEEIAALEDSLLSISKKIQDSEDDKLKEQLNNQFTNLLKSTLEQNASFKHEFTKLKNIVRLSTPDKKYNIITWMMNNSAGVYKYFGFTQYYDKKLKKTFVYQLNDSDTDVGTYTTYGDSTWYGILYYEMVPVKMKKKNMYFILGFDANDWVSKKRIIEPIIFDKQGKPSFGAPVFQEGPKTVIKKVKVDKNAPPKPTKKIVKERDKYRVIFEHSAQASMSLSYNKQLKMIVFDHLAPSDEKYKGIAAFYAPDFSYDAFVLKQDKWYLKKNVDARNPRKVKATKSELIPQNIQEKTNAEE